VSLLKERKENQLEETLKNKEKMREDTKAADTFYKKNATLSVRNVKENTVEFNYDAFLELMVAFKNSNTETNSVGTETLSART
jgi:hypothetical protein